MDGLISTFHISWKLLIAQAVNFAIVFAVLHRFAFKPISRVLSERKTEIEKGLEDAEKSRELLKNAEQRAEEILSDARYQAGEFLREAKQKRDTLLEQMYEEVAKERTLLLQKAKEDAERERKRIEGGVFSRVSEFLPHAIAKILHEEDDEEIRSRYNERIEQLIQKEL